MKYKIEYHYNWDGVVEIEADSQKEAEDLFYEALSENDLYDKYCPQEWPGDGYAVDKITPVNKEKRHA